MAELLLRDRLKTVGVAATVASRGLLDGDQPVPDTVRASLADRGIDARSFRSTPLTADDVRSAGMIVGMERRHVREAVLLDPEALPRSFTFRDLIRRAVQEGPRGEAPMADWLGRLSAERTSIDLMGDFTPDAVPDPMGHPQQVVDAVAAEIDDLVWRLVWLAFGGPAPTSLVEPVVTPPLPPPRLAGAARRSLFGRGPGRRGHRLSEEQS